MVVGFSNETAMGKDITVGKIFLHGRVMEVVKDFNYSTLHNAVRHLSVNP
jgi:hypothetical protein